MKKCKICGKWKLISDCLGICGSCIKENNSLALDYIEHVHKKTREVFGLPVSSPKEDNGLICKICMNECKIPDGAYGYCGIRKNQGGKLIGVSSALAKLSWYYDPLPTNCVADWVCPGGTGSGYPKFSYSNGPEYGYKNLAIFFHACSFNCLYCQNWQFKKRTYDKVYTDIEDLLKTIKEDVSCICFFGGDPTCQLPFALRFSNEALKRKTSKILRICWETNGSMNPSLLKEMMDLSLESGGVIKFDIKAWNENLHFALTGVSNRRTLKNFELASSMLDRRKEPPPLIASTLLVPGYVDVEEVRNISRFIASLSNEIPYSLLAFYPNFFMNDLPTTSKDLAYKCYEVAKEAGLKNVKIGNIHLLK